VGSIADVKNEDSLGGDDLWTLYGGAATEIFGFKVGGGYGTEEIGGSERDYFNIGVGAGFGPANVSVNYGQILDSEGLAGGAADEPSNLVFSADVGLMPGLVLAGDVSFFDNDLDGAAEDALDVDSEGWQAVVRLGLAF
jgi:hypothetical protein